MKQIHNIRIRVLDREKETCQKIIDTLLFAAKIEKKDVEIKISDDGEDDPLYIYELWVDHQQPIRKITSHIVTCLPSEEKTTVHDNPHKFLDTGTHCFLRLDKRKAQEGTYVFSETPDCVHVRLNIAAFPATKEKAAKIVQELFG